MATKLPQFVRLPDELYLGIVADLETGWSIAGLDIKPSPTDESSPEYKFVQTALRQGKLEPASQGEWDFLQEHHERVIDLATPVAAGEALGTWNEPAMQSTMRDDRKQLVKLRNEDHARRSGETEDDDEPSSEYAAYSNQKLKEELKRRGLETTGTKGELRGRLEEDDASKE